MHVVSCTLYFFRLVDAIFTFSETFLTLLAQKKFLNSTTLMQNSTRLWTWLPAWPTFAQIWLFLFLTRPLRQRSKSCRMIFLKKLMTTLNTSCERMLDGAMVEVELEEVPFIAQNSGQSLMTSFQMTPQPTMPWKASTQGGIRPSFPVTTSGQWCPAFFEKMPLPTRDTWATLLMLEIHIWVQWREVPEKSSTVISWPGWKTLPRGLTRLRLLNTCLLSVRSQTDDKYETLFSFWLIFSFLFGKQSYLCLKIEPFLFFVSFCFLQIWHILIFVLFSYLCNDAINYSNDLKIS